MSLSTGLCFLEVSRLSLSGTVPYYLPDIGTGFPVFESPHFSILYPFYFFGLLNYGGPLASLYTLTNLTLLHIFIFYANLYLLLRCATITALGVVHWRIRWDAGAKHGTLRKLHRHHSQLCLATVSACRRRATLAISWEGLWNTRVFHCDRPSGIGERLTAGNSLRPDVSDTFCGRCYLDVSGAALYRYLALSLLSGCAHLHRVRPCRSRDPSHVYRYGRNDTHRRSTCFGRSGTPTFHGKFSTSGNSH